MASRPASSPPRVLQALTGMEVDGGIASVSRCVARALDEHTRAGKLAGSDRLLLLDDPRHAPAAPLGGRQHLARGSQARFALQLWAARWRSRPDLVFFDQLGPARSLRMPLPGLGYDSLRYAVFCHGIELERARTGNYRAPLLHAWRLVVNSEHTGRFVRANFPEVEDRVRVVPLCIDPRRIEGWQALPAERGERQPAALIVGRMEAEEPGKGHEALIDAWSRVRAALPAAELWVVGGGDDVDRLRARARDAGQGDAVRFLGRVPDDELARLYAHASLFAMPSRQEGFGLVYAEAMWHGLPCIASDADAGGEVVLDGETGTVVPYGDAAAIAAAVLGLLRDPARARSMGEAGRARARERYAYPRFRDDLLAALELA